MNLNYEQAKTMCENVVASFITGSHAYGMNTENSDMDMKAISILPLNYLFKTGEPIETLTLHPEDFEKYPEFLELLNLKEPTDYEIHTLNKFLELAKKGNPTILEMLFCNNRFIVKRGPELDILLECRDATLSKIAINAFAGYARQQFIRIKHGFGIDVNDTDGMMRDLYDSMSRIVDAFNLKYNEVCIMSHYDDSKDEEARISLDFKKPITLPETLSLITDIKQCRESYMTLNAKNKRKDDGKMFKHAAHLIRLLKTGIELSNQKTMNVYRKDAGYLLDIRRGKYSMETLLETANDLFVILDESMKNTTLPDFADISVLDDAYLRIMIKRFQLK